MKPQTEDIEAVIRQAIVKYEAGRMAYGQLNLATDSCINYCVFQIIRIRSIKDV